MVSENASQATSPVPVFRVVRAVGRHLGCSVVPVTASRGSKEWSLCSLLPALNDAGREIAAYSCQDGHVDGVKDAIAATAASSRSLKTLRQHPHDARILFSDDLQISGWSGSPFATKCFSGVPKCAAKAT